MEASSFLCFMLSGLTLALLVNLSQAQTTPQDYLDPQNAARAEVGVGPLKWDDTVAAYAQDYANQRAGDCEGIHSDGEYGENIAWSTMGPLSAADAVGLWLSEKNYYDYNLNTCLGEECLHYTQVVWAKSVRLGCASVSCDTGGTFVTCNYDPPGNYNGERPY